MSFLAPGWLWLGLLAIPILILYMLRLRRQEIPVSSILLWRLLMRDQQANAPWQKLERNLLLFLQLLALAALVLALARPAWLVPSLVSGSVVVILDGSASMLALDGEEGATRFDTASLAALELVGELPANARMSLVLAGDPPQILAAAENDPARLRQALESAQAAPVEADWPATLALAAGAASAPGQSEQGIEFILISDGGLSLAERAGAGTTAPSHLNLPGHVRLLPVGAQTSNLAVAALALRPTRTGVQLFARLQNYAAQPQSAILGLYKQSGDQPETLLEARSLLLEPFASQSVVLEGLPEGAARYSARLQPPPGGAADLFPLDDAAYAIYTPAQVGRALLVTPGNLFLEQLLASLEGVQAFRLNPPTDGALELPAADYDWYIFDGVAPAEPPIAPASILLVNPPDSALLPVTGVFTNTQPASVSASPLLAAVDWSDVHIRQARQVSQPAWLEPLITAPGGALLLAGEQEGRRMAVLTFALQDSDLPLQTAYPILMANLVRYLLPLSDPLAASSASGLQSSVPALPPGFYTLERPDQPALEYAVNLFSPLESDLAARPEIQLGGQSIAPATTTNTGQRELWPWLAGLGWLALLAEWALYQSRRRMISGWRDLLPSWRAASR
jgi:Ca-activated chloride channel family protein